MDPSQREELIRRTQDDMRTKVAWARRELDLLSQIDQDLTSPAARQAAQDRFWTFLSAGRMLWFYLSRLCDQLGARGQGGGVVDRWLALQGPEARHVWDTLAALRDLDVHTEPVDVSLQQNALGILRVDGRLARVGGQLARVSIVRTCFTRAGAVVPCVPFGRQVLPLLERFVEEFPAHLP